MKNKIMKYILMTSLCMSTLIGGTISLKEGWNAIGTNSVTTLTEIQNQLGNTLLNIQSPDGTKIYNSSSTRSPSFVNFEIGVGYWLKVNSSITLTTNEETFSSDQSIPLDSGWNLIDPLTNLTLSEIQSQIGSSLLNIQSPDGTKIYNSSSTRTPSFVNFEDGLGYWIKVNSNSSLNFTFESLTENAKNGQLSNTAGSFGNYTFNVLTDSTVSSTGQSISIYSSINGSDIGNILAINSGYPLGAKFQIQVLENGEIVGSSDIFTLTETIKSGLEFTTEDIIITENITNTEPTIQSLSPVTLTAGANTTIPLTVSDSDNDTVSVTAVSNNTSVATVNVNGTSLSIVAGSSGTATITLTPNDGTVDGTAITLIVNVTSSSNNNGGGTVTISTPPTPNTGTIGSGLPTPPPPPF